VAVIERRKDDLFSIPSLVRVSDQLYQVIAEKVEERLGKYLRKITWEKLFLAASSWGEHLPETVIVRLRKKTIHLPMMIWEVEYPKMHIGEVTVSLHLPLYGPVREQTFLWSQLLSSIGVEDEARRLSLGIVKVNSELLLKVVISGEELPWPITLPPEKQTNGAGQKCFVTVREFRDEKYSIIR
jgi:hypothetical protein